MKQSFETAKDIFRESNSILRRSEASRLGINPKTLSDMVVAGWLVREGRGLYRLADVEPLGNPDIIYVSQRVPNAVICLISALAFYELTSHIPYKVYIALPRTKTRVEPRIEYPPIEVVWLSNKPYYAGIERKTIDGFSISMYSREKTIADCFKFRHKIGKDVAMEALQEYMRLKDRDVSRLLDSARIDRVEKVMLPYVEALA